MKSRVLIIEDNFYRYFTLKQLLEAKLRVNVAVVGIQSKTDLVAATHDLDPHTIVYHPRDGAVGVLEQLKRRRTNRRNTEVTLFVCQEFSGDDARSVDGFVRGYGRIAKAA